MEEDGVLKALAAHRLPQCAPVVLARPHKYSRPYAFSYGADSSVFSTVGRLPVGRVPLCADNAPAIPRKNPNRPNITGGRAEPDSGLPPARSGAREYHTWYATPIELHARASAFWSPTLRLIARYSL